MACRKARVPSFATSCGTTVGSMGASCHGGLTQPVARGDDVPQEKKGALAEKSDGILDAVRNLVDRGSKVTVGPKAGGGWQVAYEAWYAAKRGLDDAMPWTPDWLRLRM